MNVTSALVVQELQSRRRAQRTMPPLTAGGHDSGDTVMVAIETLRREEESYTNGVSTVYQYQRIPAY